MYLALIGSIFSVFYRNVVLRPCVHANGKPLNADRSPTDSYIVKPCHVIPEVGELKKQAATKLPQAQQMMTRL